MVSFPRIAITTAIVLAAAAPATAEGIFSELQGIRTDVSPPPAMDRSVLSDLPEAAPDGAQALPGNQPHMTLQRIAPPNSSARGGWYQTRPSLTLRGSDPSPASKGPQIKYQMFKPNGAPVR
jgi:hypothetical protein